MKRDPRQGRALERPVVPERDHGPKLIMIGDAARRLVRLHRRLGRRPGRRCLLAVGDGRVDHLSERSSGREGCLADREQPGFSPVTRLKALTSSSVTLRSARAPILYAVEISNS